MERVKKNSFCDGHNNTILEHFQHDQTKCRKVPLPIYYLICECRRIGKPDSATSSNQRVNRPWGRRFLKISSVLVKLFVD